MDKIGRIFLLGFMGSGKSTLGKKLAAKLKRDFVDLDELIEEKEKCSIQKLFDTKGEDYFRTIEHEYLKRLINVTTNQVISLGGGTPCFYGNMELMNESGVSIYIKYNAGILTNRLINAKIERPLIKGKTREELSQYINDTLAFVANNNIKVEDLISLFQDR